MKQHNEEVAIEWSQKVEFPCVRKLNSPGMMSVELINDFFNVNRYVLMHVK